MALPLSVLLGGAQVAAGIFANKGPRPSWQIPGAAYEDLSMARQQANATTRPGDADAKAVLRSSTNQTLNNVKRTAGSGQEILASAIALNNNENKALVQNNIENDQFRFNAKRNLAQTLGRFAGYQREKFIEDTIKPYQDRVQAKQALIGSGLQNVFGGLNAANNQQQQQQYLDYLTGGGGAAGTQTGLGLSGLFGKFRGLFGGRGGVAGVSGGYGNPYTID